MAFDFMCCLLVGQLLRYCLLVLVAALSGDSQQEYCLSSPIMMIVFNSRF